MLFNCLCCMLFVLIKDLSLIVVLDVSVFALNKFNSLQSTIQFFLEKIFSGLQADISKIWDKI